MRAALQPPAQPASRESCSLLFLCPRQPLTAAQPSASWHTSFWSATKSPMSDSFSSVMYCSHRTPVAAIPEAFNRSKVGAC